MITFKNGILSGLHRLALGCVIVLIANAYVHAEHYSRINISIPFEAQNLPDFVRYLDFDCSLTLQRTLEGQNSSYTEMRNSYGYGGRVEVNQSGANGQARALFGLSPYVHYDPNDGILGNTLDYTCRVTYLDEDHNQICVPSASHDNPGCRVTEDSVTEVSGSFEFRPPN